MLILGGLLNFYKILSLFSDLFLYSFILAINSAFFVGGIKAPLIAYSFIAIISFTVKLVFSRTHLYSSTIFVLDTVSLSGFIVTLIPFL